MADMRNMNITVITTIMDRTGVMSITAITAIMDRTKIMSITTITAIIHTIFPKMDLQTAM